MTEKRFTLHIVWFNYEKTEGEATLKNNGQPLLESECVEDMRRLKDLLNELNDENEQLKQQIKKLESQLYCPYDSICINCVNEYLVQKDKYYVSKCKKGHEQCSRTDVKYCDDFELKGDVE